VSKKSTHLSRLLVGVCLPLLLLALASEVSADEIEFKNGAIVRGTVTAQDNKTLSINVDGKIMTYSMSDIKNIEIEGQEISPPSPLSVDGVEADSPVNDSNSTVKDSIDVLNPLYGNLNPERAGFRVANTKSGTLNISVWAYIRYINQLNLDPTYTDGSGIEKSVDQRNDIQFSKTSIQFKGWIFDERLIYLAYVWASPNVMGQATAFALVGNIEYLLTDRLKIGGGIQGLPTSRAMELSHPRFNRVDVRSMTGEYFRGSYAAGIWLEGQPIDDLYFRAMIANSLSKLGVDAGQIDTKLATWSAGAWWLPNGSYATPGMIWNGGGYGDFEDHQEAAFRLGAHYTNSVESAESQPDVNDPENSQIRVSDGRLIFKSPEIFNGGLLDELRYQMVAMDAGFKYKGFALEGEIYFRHLNDFEFLNDPGDFGFDYLKDTGFSIQPSYFFLKQKLQGYLIGSKIWGDYGDPWDGVIGLNWYPLKSEKFQRQFRINADAQYTSQSPIGNLSLPYTVGGKGWTYSVIAEMFF
jgi:hypothetical protein